MLELHAVLFWKYLRYQMLVLTYRGDEAAQEHKDIFDAALARDSEAAHRAAWYGRRMPGKPA